LLVVSAAELEAADDHGDRIVDLVGRRVGELGDGAKVRTLCS
jgi:hypothetical protein